MRQHIDADTELAHGRSLFEHVCLDTGRMQAKRGYEPAYASTRNQDFHPRLFLFEFGPRLGLVMMFPIDL
jgi:hypothetical protein